MNEQDITYFCLAEAKVLVKIAFAFLESIQKTF
jgi:hypothetical protein